MRCLRWATLGSLTVLAIVLPVQAQGPDQPTSPLPSSPSPVTNEDLAKEIRQLKAEVAETRQLKDQVIQLQNELYQPSQLGRCRRRTATSRSVVGREVPPAIGPACRRGTRDRGETMTSHTLDTGGSRE